MLLQQLQQHLCLKWHSHSEGSSAAAAAVRASGRRQCVVTCAAPAAAGSSDMTTAPAAGGSRRIVLFFRNDLRLRDNGIVASAVQKVAAREYDEVLPLYCFDPRFFAHSPWGLSKTGSHRAAFLQQSVADLQSSLRGIGSGLLVSCGSPEQAIAAALEGCAEGGGLVLTQQEVTSEELDVDAAIRRAIKGKKAQLQCLWGPTLYHRDDLPYSEGLADLPNTFTPFREKVEKKCQVRAELPAPRAGQLPLPASLAAPLQQQLDAPLPSWQELPWPAGHVPQQPEANPKAALQFKGGEAAALARLRFYLWDSDLVARYFELRNGMLGGDYSTKLAPWLAAGCLSPRTVFHEVARYERERTANKSTYWVHWELTCRDWFRLSAAKHGRRIFLRGGTAGMSHLRWSADPELWQRWSSGTTGLPLIDANMRELRATGWMSNRGRQNVASYLALDLGLDWRRGADLFEHCLLDYDVASNWGNWVAAAGVTGGRLNHFNIAKQSKDYDPDGEYIRHWLPELARVPAARIHQPWLMSRDEQAAAGVQIGQDYPAPIPATRFGRPHGGEGVFVGGDPSVALPLADGQQKKTTAGGGKARRHHKGSSSSSSSSARPQQEPTAAGG